jgi:hypothetical protein
VDLRDGLKDLPAKLSVAGVLGPDQVVHRLSAGDLLLFVRGPISSRRGSALAGIACGLPIIALERSETGPPPVAGAGVVPVLQDDLNAFNAALVRILSDARYREDLAARSRAAHYGPISHPCGYDVDSLGGTGKKRSCVTDGRPSNAPPVG